MFLFGKKQPLDRARFWQGLGFAFLLFAILRESPVAHAYRNHSLIPPRYLEEPIPRKWRDTVNIRGDLNVQVATRDCEIPLRAVDYASAEGMKKSPVPLVLKIPAGTELSFQGEGISSTRDGTTVQRGVRLSPCLPLAVPAGMTRVFSQGEFTGSAATLYFTPQKGQSETQVCRFWIEFKDWLTEADPAMTCLLDGLKPRSKADARDRRESSGKASKAGIPIRDGASSPVQSTPSPAVGATEAD